MEMPTGEFTRGTVFAGRYEILEELGGGGMGKVFRVFDRKLEEEVALKLIRPEIAADRKAIERFRNEIKTARKITHKNVCKMYDLGESGGASYITMEYVPGEDLRSFIHRSKQLTVATAVSITRQVAEGLSEAHGLGIIHRDLKPGNIMIDKEGNAKIMDFGIARSLLGKGLTGEGAIIGTPEYMSPEQVEGKEADQRADIYALGVILFEMLVGSPPFEGETPFAIANKHKTEPPPVPKKLLPQLPDALNKIILRCLEKERANRYQTAGDLLVDLSAVEQTLPTADRALTHAKTRIRTSREITVKLSPRKLIIPAAAVVLLAAAAVILFRFGLKKPIVYPPPIENSFLVVGFENQTGDEGQDNLQAMIPSLLRTKFEQTGVQYVTSRERTNDLMQQMGKQRTDFIPPDLGFELARRDGAKALVCGFYGKTGETYVTNIQVLDVSTKKTLASATSSGRGAESILTHQIDDLCSGIFKKLEVTEDQLENAKAPVTEVATSSMEAYQLYLQGLSKEGDWQWDAAIELFEKAIQIDPSFFSAFAALAHAHGNLGNKEAALKAIEQARLLSKRATEKDMLSIRVFEADYLGGWEKVVPDLEAFLTRFPKDKDVHYWLGKAFSDIGDSASAIRELKTAIEMDPNEGYYHNLLALVLAKAGDYKGAVEAAKKYASREPKNPNAFDTMACIFLDWGRLEEAEDSWRKAIDTDPNFHYAFWGLVYLCALKEDYPEAMRRIERDLAADHSKAYQAETLVLRGILHLWQGRFSRSIEAFERAAELYRGVADERSAWLTDSYKAAAYCERGEYELSQKYYLTAGDSYSKASGEQTAATGAEEAYALAWNDLMAGRRDSARQRLEQITVFLPDISRSAEWRAPSIEGLRKKIEYLREFLVSEISLRDARVDMERIRRNFAQTPDYITSFLSSISDTGSVSYFYDYLYFPPPLVKDTLARAYIQNRELDKAVGVYERMITFDPKSKDRRWIHPLLYYHLAKLYDQTGRKDKARASYKKFLGFWKDADPGRPEVEDARGRLSKLT
jgi:serine/threonine protein kinase/Tfp pilus assembly protein PilF